MKVHDIKYPTCHYLDHYDKICGKTACSYIYDENTYEKIYLCKIHSILAKKWGN